VYTPEELAKKEAYMEKKAGKDVRDAVGLVYNINKPQHAGDGLTSGIGNILKGAGAGIAAVGASTVIGAKSSGVGGALKGFGVGLLAGVGLTVAGVGTGVY